MRLDVRGRMLAWLTVVLVPIVIAGYFAVDVAGDQVVERVEVDLANIRRLEAARIDDMLDGYDQDARSLAAGSHVRHFTTDVVAARGAGTGNVVEGVDGFAAIDPFDDRPLDELVRAMYTKAATSGSEVLAIRIVAPDGDVLGATPEFSWEPYDDDLVERSIDLQTTLFGNAFRPAFGDDRLGVVTPVTSPAGDVVGAALFEFRLAPITDLLLEHERMGDTSEAHIAQPNRDGDAEFISVLRFARDSTFSKTVPKEKDLPINRALESPDGQIIRAGDYRQEPSILAVQTIERTGWGLVVKIDAAEADRPAEQIRNVVLFAGLASAIAVAIGWALFLRPLGDRLRRTAIAARRVAGGDYAARIGDARSDEIGELAQGIDRLAADLEADIKIRGDAEHRLLLNANQDALTGLLNRKRLAELLDEFDSSGRSELTILFIDLDGFKTVNDTFGHQIGDEVLVAVAQRLSGAVSDRGLVARWGGDEFVIALTTGSRSDADAVSDRLDQLFDDPIRTTVGHHLVRASVGRAAGRPGTASRDLLHEADAAMFERKQASRGREAVSSATLRAVELAIDDDRVEAWYQPVVSVSDVGVPIVAGAEALVRIRNDDDSLSMPGDFLPAIQDMYLGALLDRRMVSLAFDDLASWRRAGLVSESFRLAVNLSGASTRDSELADFFVAEARRADVPLGQIVVEVSEQTETLDAGLIRRLHGVGIEVAIDDVGLTHSNIDRLVDLHADVAKIDRRWLPDGGDQDARTCTALASIISLCSSLGMRVVAEGVEQEVQLELLSELGVTDVQGYYFARPSPVDVFTEAWLSNLDSELAVSI